MVEYYRQMVANLRLENQRLDGPGLESNKEFGEFGQLQAAEQVVLPEVRAMANGPNAGNLPWIMFPPDLQQRSAHSQPDILCAQNTFPRHLDSPPSVHDHMAADRVVSGAAVVSQFDANLLPDIGQNLNHGMPPNMMNGLYNAPPSVTDHQARRCDLSVAGVVNPTWRRPSYEGLPITDVPDLNQPPSWRHGNASPRGRSYDEVLNGPQRYISDQRIQQPMPAHPPAPLPPQEQQQQHHQSLQPHHHPHHQRSHPPPPTSQQMQQQQSPSVIEELGAAMSVVPKQERRRDHSDGQRDSYLLKQLDELRSRNIELTSRVDSLQVQLSEQKSKYESLQAKHASDLEAIRQAGHDALAVVVEEYKSLCRTAVLPQQEMTESHLKDKLKSEADQYSQMLQEQHEQLFDVLKKEKEENDHRIKTAFEEQKSLERDELEKYFHQEQNRYQESLQKVMSEEPNIHQRSLEEALHQQQLDSQNKFKEEMTLMKYEIKSIQDEYLEERKKALQDEKEAREVIHF
ncbi:adenylate cyclase, terminal-differentiation specific-like [Argonauta hians]